jgi:hypothetical protein
MINASVVEKRNSKFFSPIKGLANIPFLRSRFWKAMISPAMGE